MGFQVAAEMPRPNDTFRRRNPKRRRLDDNSFEEVLLCPHAISSLVPEQHGYADIVARGEEDKHISCNPPCERDVEASAGIIGHDGSSECCYGMVEAATIPTI